MIYVCLGTMLQTVNISGHINQSAGAIPNFNQISMPNRAEYAPSGINFWSQSWISYNTNFNTNYFTNSYSLLL